MDRDHFDAIRIQSPSYPKFYTCYVKKSGLFLLIHTIECFIFFVSSIFQYFGVLRIHEILVWIRSADSYLRLLDPDPANFVIDLPDVNKILLFFKVFTNYFFYGTFTSFFKHKSHKEVKTVRSMFLLRYYFCLMIEGPVAGSGSVYLTNGPRSGRPKTYGSYGSGSRLVEMYTDTFRQALDADADPDSEK